MPILSENNGGSDGGASGYDTLIILSAKDTDRVLCVAVGANLAFLQILHFPECVHPVWSCFKEWISRDAQVTDLSFGHLSSSSGAGVLKELSRTFAIEKDGGDERSEAK